MRILDRYVVKQFLQTILFGIVAFTLIFVIIDMMENLDDFIDNNVPGNLIVQYYLVFTPEIIRLVLPISVLLSALFTVGKMAGQNELAAIKSSGVSLYRFMAPFIVTALIISVFAIFFGGYVVPNANKHKVFIEQTYMKKGIVHTGSNIFFQDSPTRIVTISYFDVDRNIASRVSVQEYNPDNINQMKQRIDANMMTWDSTFSGWKLINGLTRNFDQYKQASEKFDTLKLDYLNFDPEDVMRKQQKPEEMDLGELMNFANDQLEAGNDPTRILIEYHSRIALAFASFVVVLFGLPLSSNKRKGGIAIQFGIAIGITFVYLVFMKISQAFGKNGVLNPVITAWLSNFIFLGIAVVNIFRAPK